MVNDLGGSVGGVIFLEDFKTNFIDSDIVVLSQSNIDNKIGKGLSDAEVTSYLARVLLDTQTYGNPDNIKLD